MRREPVDARKAWLRFILLPNSESLVIGLPAGNWMRYVRIDGSETADGGVGVLGGGPARMGWNR